jgi:FtsZ-binding cell division protein ZapB
MAPSTPNRTRAGQRPLAISSPPKLKRNRIPSRKAQEQTIAIDTDDESQTEGDHNVTDLIIALKEVIEQQSATIKEIREDLQEIKAEQHELNKQNEELKSQNTELREEIRELQTRFNTFSVSPPFTQSWASIAAGQSAAGPSSNLTRATNRESLKEATSIRISTHPTNEDTDHEGEPTETLQRYLPTETANTLVRNALQNNEATKEAQVAGIGTTKTGYVIRFRDEKSTQAARGCAQWLETLGNGTKFVRPRFGVVAHRTPTENITLPEDQAKVIQNIMEENDLGSRGYQIAEVAWLKRQDKQLGHTASLGVWFDTAEAAEWSINHGLVFGQRFIGSVEAYQVKKKRCYRCLRNGHLAWACKEKPQCGHCAGDHERRDCPPDTRAKCIDCNEAHSTGDRECRHKVVSHQ